MSLLLATQISAIATAVLAVFAILTTIYAVRAFRKQSQEVSDQASMLQVQSEQLAEQRKVNAEQIGVLALQAAELRESLEQRQRDADEQRRSQATRVTAWLGTHKESKAFWGANVRNASDEPLFEVRVFFHHMREKEGGGYQAVSQGGPPPRETIAVLPPGEDRFVWIPADVQAMFGSIAIDDRNCAASIEFTDAAGNQWERDPRGALVPRS